LAIGGGRLTIGGGLAFERLSYVYASYAGCLGLWQEIQADALQRV
jgi:hypothetical protein